MLLILVNLLCVNFANAQDTLPDFSAVIRQQNKVQISWVNVYQERIRQLSIQRSRDSQRLFKTIVSIPDPKVYHNGYIDSKTDSNYYYRLYILLDSGRYIFSIPRKPRKYIPPPKVPVKLPPSIPAEEIKATPAGVKPPRPSLDKNEIAKAPVQAIEKPKPPAPKPEPVPEKIYTIKRGDSIAGELREPLFKWFRDSVSTKTKDTIASVKLDTIYIKPFIVKDLYKLSKYIFPDKSGVVHIELPEAPRRKYLVKFFEEDKSLLFEVKNIRDQLLLLDKANFQHAGWFLFEIYDADVLLEKNRFYINKDF